MDECDEVERPEQRTQCRHSQVKKNKSEIKQENKMSKTESRFKSKLESLKKLQYSASANSAVEKARAFFRSLELKHLGGHSSSSESSSTVFRRRHGATTTTTTTTNNNNNKKANNNGVKITHMSSSSKIPLISSTNSLTVVDRSKTTRNGSSLNVQNSSHNVETARIAQVINPNYASLKDVSVHRVIENDLGEHRLSSSHLNHQQRSLKRNDPLPDHHRNHVHSESRRFSPDSSSSSPITYSSHSYRNSPSSIQSTSIKGHVTRYPITKTLYDYRPSICRQMESPSLMSSSFHEQSNRSLDSIIRPLPSSSSSTSMAAWAQSVRRLNLEYTSTINALQKAKESLRQIYSNQPDTVSKYANLVAREIDELSNAEIKKAIGVTFCLTASTSEDTSISSTLSTSNTIKPIVQQSTLSESNIFSKPKLVRPLELETFVPSISSLTKPETVSITIVDDANKTDSIANIIKKFNSFNHSPSSNLNKDKSKKNYEVIQSNIDNSHISSITSITDNENTFSNSAPHVRLESPQSFITSSSTSSSTTLSSSESEDSTSSTSPSSSNENLVFEHNRIFDKNLQEETTYTIETFYKRDNTEPGIKAKTENLLLKTPEIVIVRENTTEEQFNLAQEKQGDDINHHVPRFHTYTINETKVPPLTTPLFTYLNLTGNKTSPTSRQPQEQEKMHDTYHSVETLSHITNDFISNVYCNEDDQSINDVIAINPHTYSPKSNHLIDSSSSSSSSTTSSTTTPSSASTVLLSCNNNTDLSASSNVAKLPSNTNGSLTKNNNSKPISQLPKRTTNTTSTVSNISRLKQPSKIVSPASKLKPPSTTTVAKPIKTMITNSTSATTTTAPSMRKPTGITNQSSATTTTTTTTANNFVNKSIQQQSSSSTLITGKKQQSVNGTNMTESQNPTDSSYSIGKSRVRSMVNQFNAAVTSSTSSSLTTIPSTRSIISSNIPIKCNSITPTSVNSPRPMSIEPITKPANKTTTELTTTTIPNRGLFQRAMTLADNDQVTSLPSTNKRKIPLIRSTSNVKEGLLRWCQVQVAGYPNVSITNLSSSWADGLAFCALVHHFFPDAFDFTKLSAANRKENFELAFRTAEERAGVPRLLDVSDMLIMGNTPDYKCIFTYLNSFLAKVKDIHPSTNGMGHN